MLRVRVAYSGIGGTPYLSTFWFIGTITGTAPQDAADAVSTFMGALDGYMDSAVNWSLDTQVVEVDAGTGQATASAAVTGATGTGGLNEESLPFASQGLIQLRTGVYIDGRELRGRFFIPALTESSNNDGALTLARVGNINSTAAALVADIDAPWAVYSRTKATVAQITSAACWGQFAVLRSRRPSF